MLFEIFRFECRYQLRSALFPIVSLVFLLMAFFAMASDDVTVGGIGNNLNLNASFAIMTTQFVFSIIAMFAGVAFVANAITRDYENKTAELFFSTRLPERDYLFGRFLGGLGFALLTACAALLGTLIGTFMPWLDPERIGAFSFAPYWFSIWAVTLPNVFIACGLFFSVAALTCSMFSAYVAALGLLVFSLVVGANTDAETLAMTSVLDPFASIAFGEVTRYWTVFDRNTLVPEMTGSMLQSRLLWLGLTTAALAVTVRRYRFDLSPPRRWRRRRPKPPAPAPGLDDALPAPRPRFDRGLPLRQFVSQVRMDVRGVVRSVPFYVLLVFGMVNVLGGFYVAITQAFGTSVLPVTRMMIQTIASNFLFVVLIILIYYAGELVHRERQAGLAEIADATP